MVGPTRDAEKEYNNLKSKLKTLDFQLKYGVEIPKSVKDAIEIYKSNVNTLWWEVIFQEMKNVMIYFEIYEVNVKELPQSNTWCQDGR